MKRFCRFLIIFLIASFELMAIDPVTSELLKKGEFAERREALITHLKGGIAIFKGADYTSLNHNESARFVQESNFYYLTGFTEPGAYIILVPQGNHHRFIMFVKPRNLLYETWTGAHHGIEEAKSIYGAGEAYPVSEFEIKLEALIKDYPKIFCSFKDSELITKVTAALKKSSNNHPPGLEDPGPLVAELRLIKSSGEVQLMQKAIDITGHGLAEVIKAVTPGMTENRIDGMLQYMFTKEGAIGTGFPSIVASGPNASIMHYTFGSRRMTNGELLLLDIGADYGYYGADITRTIPVSGRFSKKQKRIYDLVLNAQMTGIQATAPGKGLREVMNAALDVMTEGMFKLGLITDKNSQWQKMLWFRYLQLSHWLGIDTHDVGNYKWSEPGARILEPGMIFTMEPGIYIDASLLDKLPQFMERLKLDKKEVEGFISKVKPVALEYDGISVRIEDDILVTDRGYIVLSAKIPKTVKAIESLCKQSSPFNKL